MKELYCITCPNGCLLTVTDEAGEFGVEGNDCKRGEDFARAELTNPMRSLTTTVRTTFPDMPVLPVRTDGEIPKGKIAEVMRALKGVIIRRPVECGDTVMGNAAGTGVRIIATCSTLHSEGEQIEQYSPEGADDKPQSGAGNYLSAVRHVSGQSVGDSAAEATGEGAGDGTGEGDGGNKPPEDGSAGGDYRGDKRSGRVRIKLPK